MRGYSWYALYLPSLRRLKSTVNKVTSLRDFATNKKESRNLHNAKNKTAKLYEIIEFCGYDNKKTVHFKN